MKEQTRKELQQKMADYRQPAPEISWDELEKALALNRQAQPKAKTVMMWPRRIAVAAAVLLVAGIGWQVLRQEEAASPSRQDVVAKAGKNVETPVLAGEEADDAHATYGQKLLTPPLTPPLHGRGKATGRRVSGNAAAALIAEAKETVSPSAEDDKDSNLIVSEVIDAQDGEQQQIGQNQQAEQKHQAGQYQQHTQQVIYPSDLHHHSTHASNRLTAKAYMANTMAGSNSYNSFTPMLMDANAYGETNSDMNGEISMPLYEQQPEMEEGIHHHQPIRFGLSLRYQLNDRWSVEGGLSYTYLSSDITHDYLTYINEIEQRLSYVGIPLSANYLLWSNRHFSVYASAGGIIEKMVKGSRSTQTVTGNQPEPSQKESVSIHPLQLSLTGAVGAEYNLGNAFSIYAEPGVAYHFDNHSAIPTYYQDKPLGFNLNIGLRFNLNK